MMDGCATTADQELYKCTFTHLSYLNESHSPTWPIVKSKVKVGEGLLLVAVIITSSI